MLSARAARSTARATPRRGAAAAKVLSVTKQRRVARAHRPQISLASIAAPPCDWGGTAGGCAICLLPASNATVFARAVYHLTAARLPAGTVATYGYIAEVLGCPGGARAVGSALRKNVLNIDHGVVPRVPCHRVVRSDGGMGGFNGGGCKVKEDMLWKEGVVLGEDGRVVSQILSRNGSNMLADMATNATE
jgi:O-6-methylguanine DNA methyltransferase